MGKKRLIYVNEQSGPSSALGQMFQNLQAEWETVLTGNLRDAAKLMGGRPFDALVLDASRTTDGEVKFLKEAASRHPKLQRFVLTRADDPDAMKQWSGAPAEFLSGQSEPETIESGIRRAFMLDQWMENEALRGLVAQIRHLPSRPTLYTQIMRELQSPDRDVERVAMWLAADPALCAKVLQVVNSAVYALARQITSAFEAVMFLGLEATKSLVLFTQVVSAFDLSKCRAIAIEALWYHSISSASYARWIALAESDDAARADEAYTAGLLHDAGKLMLAGNLPDRYNAAAELAARKGVTLWRAEQETLGATHAELGACLLAKWGLPYSILEAMAWHHQPDLAPRKSFLPLTAVHVANALEHQKNPVPGSQADTDIDSDYLKNIGMTEHLANWVELCGK